MTPEQMSVLRRAAAAPRVRLDALSLQEAACELDALGLIATYSDSANSSGVLVAAMTPAGRAALAKMESADE